MSSSAAGPRSDQPRRRVFAAEYDRASAPGERGGLLRREGMYPSHIIEWRKARDTGTLVTRPAADQPHTTWAEETEETQRSAPQRRRRGKATTEQAEVERLRQQNEKLARDLARTQAALDIMGSTRALGTALRERGADARAGPGR